MNYRFVYSCPCRPHFSGSAYVIYALTDLQFLIHQSKTLFSQSYITQVTLHYKTSMSWVCKIEI